MTEIVFQMTWMSAGMNLFQPTRSHSLVFYVMPKQDLVIAETNITRFAMHARFDSLCNSSREKHEDGCSK
jgi:hypothetical protein